MSNPSERNVNPASPQQPASNGSTVKPELPNLSAAKMQLLAKMRKVATNGAKPVQTIPPRAQQGPLPLSFAQQRLWFLDQMGVGATYHLPWLLRFSGLLDTAALERALQAIVQRHEALRTIFPTVGRQPRQVILPDFVLPLSLLSLVETPPSERWAALQKQIETVVEQPFHLVTGPLCSVNLYHMADDEH